MIEKKEGASTMANAPGAHVRLLEADVSRVPSASGMTWVEMPSAITTPTPRPSSEYITLTARNDERCVAAHSIGTAGADESHVSRVLRLAIGAGFAPTNAWDDPTGAEAVFVRFANGTVVRLFAGMNVEAQLRQYAGPDNQPEAVRARKVNALDGRPHDQCKLTSHGLHVLDANGHRCVACGYYAMPPIHKIDAEIKAIPPDSWPLGKPWTPPRICTWNEYMVESIIARQVEQGGVDTEGSRAEAERWCAMLAGCVCDGMRATTEKSALRLVGRELEVVEVFEEKNYFSSGKPLGRP